MEYFASYLSVVPFAIAAYLTVYTLIDKPFLVIARLAPAVVLNMGAAHALRGGLDQSEVFAFWTTVVVLNAWSIICILLAIIRRKHLAPSATDTDSTASHPSGGQSEEL